eukprot:1741627-Rhodomonas_salina.3
MLLRQSAGTFTSCGYPGTREKLTAIDRVPGYPGTRVGIPTRVPGTRASKMRRILRIERMPRNSEIPRDSA